MKLAMVLYSYFPFGGLQSDFRNFLKEALDRGHQVRIYCRSWESQGEIDLSNENIERVILENSATSNHKANEEFIEAFHQHIKENPVDVVFGFNKMSGLDVYFAADTCYREKTEEQNKTAIYKMSPRYKHFCDVEEDVFHAGGKTKILLISETEKSKFIKHYKTEGHRLFMLPPGISREKAYPEDGKIRAIKLRNEFNLGNENILLFVGSGFKTKGLDRAIEALAALPQEHRSNTRLLVIGADKPEKFLAQTKKLKIDDRVVFLGGRDDVSRFMWAADLLIHPAYAEAAGIVLLEAVVAGLPVLVTASCGYASHIEKAKAGMVIEQPFEQQKLNCALLEMLDKKKLQVFHNNALTYAAKENLYSMHKTGMDFIEMVYAEKQRKARHES